MQVRFTIIVPTKGRPTLTHTLNSIIPSLESGDELVVERLDCLFGGDARNQGMRKATGTHLLFMDDDDIYLPDAIPRIRSAVATAPRRVHFFGMRYHEGGAELYSDPTPRATQISTQMFCVPNVRGKLGVWPSERMSDWGFIQSTMALRGEAEAVCHPFVVALIRPNGSD